MKNAEKRPNLPTIFGTRATRGYLKNNPISESIIDYLCEEVIEWSASGKKVFIEEFLVENRIPVRTWYNWLKAYPRLAEAYEEARFNVGYMRMVGAAKKKFDRSVILYHQHMFGQTWKEADEYHDNRQKKIDGSKDNKLVVEMIAAEKTNIVPEKPSKGQDDPPAK